MARFTCIAASSWWPPSVAIHGRLAGVFLAGAAATRHIPPSGKIDIVVFFPQISAVIRMLGLASLLVPENLYPVFRETEMRSNGARLPANSLAPDEALRP